MRQSGFHHANHLILKFCNEMRDSQLQMLALAKNFHIDDEEVEDPVDHHQQVANNANIVC